MSDSSPSQSTETIGSLAATNGAMGRYILEGPLGAGGMGEVYRAQDTRLKRTVAIKILPHDLAADTARRRRLLNEARAASALNHPNIVALYDIGTEKDVDFLVMEFVHGRTLREMVATGPLDLAQLVAIASQIALALGAAHGAGVVHRDIKPANIMVTSDRQVKVLDFGIAKVTRTDGQLPDAAQTRLTAVGEIVGTAAYMSPEQTRGEDTDFRSDIFSLGSVLYEIATGRLPFQADSILGLMHAIATADPEPPSVFRAELQPQFVRLVMRCLAKDRHQRPESAIELATELSALAFPSRQESPLRSQRPTVAVLPLQVRGPATDQYLSISLAEALIHRLSTTGKLLARPIASVVRYAGEEVEWTRVARELNVDLVVQGTVQVAGSKIRVLVGIHRAGEASTLASLKQDGDANDLFALQDRLADLVSDVFVPRQPGVSSNQAPPTRNAGAFELYLRAVDRQVHVDKFEMASAIELLNRATELDPAFADAWGLLAQAYTQMGAHLDPDPKWFELAERAIARTLELDPIQCTALCARSVILWSPSRSFQNRAALRALNAAIKIDPARPTARHQRSAILWHLGFLDAAERDAEELQLANPALGAMHYGAIALQRGNFDRSAEFYARALELEPNGVLMHLMAPVAVLFGGHIKEARLAIEKARKMFPAESFTLGLESIIAVLEGDPSRGETLAGEASRTVHSLTHTHHTWHSCAAAYALCGQPEKAVHELERCAGMGLPSYRLFQADPYLRGLHQDPRFNDFVTRLRREHDSIREEFELDP